MLGIQNVINEIMKSRKGENRAWIYDEKGNISNDVICGDIIPFLEELKEYEIGATEEFVENFKKNAECFYTYNYGCCIDKDLVEWYKNGEPYIVCCVHLNGDARCNFSDWFVVKMEDYYDNCPLTQFLQLESVYQTIDINDRYSADINIFQEEYDVYDCVNGESVGTDYSLEKKYLDIFKNDIDK